MQSQRAILAILLIFGAGMVAGFFLGRPAKPAPLPPQPKPGQVFRLNVDELKQRLSLKPAQEKEIRDIYTGSQKRLKEEVLPETIRQRVRKEVIRRNKAIREVLDDEQRKNFGQLPGMRDPDGGRPIDPVNPKTEGTNDSLPVPAPLKGKPTLPLPEANSTDN